MNSDSIFFFPVYTETFKNETRKAAWADVPFP